VVTGELNRVRFYHNDAGQGFTDVTRQVGLDGIVQAFTLFAVDFDNDGWMDLFVVRPFTHYRLYRNRGDGTFVDVTQASGLLDAKAPDQIAASWIAAWGDVDNDGDLDLFLANWGFRMPLLTGLMDKPRMDSKLFLNEGGHFRDATAEFGLLPIVEDRFFIGAAFGDYDDDGRVDLYLTSPLRGTSVLLHNTLDRTGGRRFAPDPRMTRTEPGFTGTFVDVNHDGRLDLFQAGFGDARTSIQQSVYGEHVADYKTGHSTILLQTPDGRFEAHNEFFDGSLPMPSGTMGANFGDLDNDGCLDFYLGTGNPEPWFILPNLMYHGEESPDGRCTGRMRNVSMLNGFGNVQKGHGIVFFDFNEDGKQDVYSSLGGMWPNDKWVSQLFVNEGRGDRSWVKIRLRGRRSNSFGVGSFITVHAVTASGAPIVRTYDMDGKTGFGSAPYLAHVGLDRAVRIDRVSVKWLGSGCKADYPARLRELNVLDEADCLRGHG
jgi:VCBS repeat protein